MQKSAESRRLTDEDQQAFQELYLKYQHLVYSTCLRMTQDASEAEDLTQDVFIRLFRTIGSFRGESAFTTWLHRVTVNLVLMHFRKRKVRPELTGDNEDTPSFVAATGSHLNFKMNKPCPTRVVRNSVA